MSMILVTGAAGFIGSHLCEALLREGSDVIALDNFNDFYSPRIKWDNMEQVMETARNTHKLCVLEQGDLLDVQFLHSLMNHYRIDAVVHLAAYAGVRPSIAQPRLYTQVNVEGTVNLLEEMKEWKIKRFVFASSSSVYGNATKMPFSETDRVDQPISIYAATKKAAELICYTYCHLYGIATACLRLFTVCGPRQRPDLAIHTFVRSISEGKPIRCYGDGSTQRDYTYIDDIVDGIRKALQWTEEHKAVYEIFNLGNSQTISLSELIAIIEEVVGKRASIERLPLQPGDVLRTYADISHATQVLGYQPKASARDGVQAFYRWYEEKKELLDE